MPAVSSKQAAVMISQSVAHLSADDLRELYNEINLKEPVSIDEVDKDRRRFELRVNEHFQQHVEPEEIRDLWVIVFPKARDIYYDDDTDTLHYSENGAPAYRTD